MLEARDITFAYTRGKTILRGVSLACEAGERLALKAPSGFGKTTLCQILAGYLKPSSGEVLLDGKPLPDRGVSPVQMILQHPELALDERLRLSASLAEAGVGHAHMNSLDDPQLAPEHLELLQRLGIRSGWLGRYPHELSGGELQRFCIARALAVRPRYLIADESSTMLDAVTQAQIWNVLLDELSRRDMGLICITHSPSLLARIATREIDLAG